MSSDSDRALPGTECNRANIMGDSVLERVLAWAEKSRLVRAVVLTSNRASPERETDELSDYDIELYVSSIEPFLESDSWLDCIAEVMVRWPYRPGPGGPEC